MQLLKEPAGAVIALIIVKFPLNQGFDSQHIMR